MKKIFVSMMAVAISVSAMAASTATANIKLVGSNATYAVSTLSLNEDDARTNAYESGYDGPSMMTQSNAYSVLLYSYIGTQPCEMVFANDLVGQKISLKTNQLDANYTLQFSNVSGRALQLYDAVTDTYTDIKNGDSYPFSVEAAQVGRVEVKDRFEIRLAPAAPSICFSNNVLDVIGYAGKNLSVKKTDGTDVIAEQVLASDAEHFDLKTLVPADTRLVVTLDGTAYQIDVNPTVSVIP